MEAGRQLRQAAARIVGADQRRSAGRNVPAGVGKDGGGAARQGVTYKVGAVGLTTAQGGKQIARPDVARVRRQAEDLGLPRDHGITSKELRKQHPGPFVH